MKYKHLRVQKVTGFVMPADQDELLLWQDNLSGDYLLLASEIDARVLNYDRRAAVSSLALNALFGGGEIPSDRFPDFLESEVLKLQSQRREQYGSGPFLLFEVSGDADYEYTKPSRDVGAFSLGFDNVDITNIKNNSVEIWQKNIAAFLLLVNGDVATTSVIDGVYLMDSAGKIHFVLSFTGGSANLTVSRQLEPNPTEVFERLRLSLIDNNNLRSVLRLLVQATAEPNDAPRSFIFAWTGLETFVNKTFKLYKDSFIQQNFVNSVTPVSRNFFDRVLEVMNDKYRLLDKFIVVSAMVSSDSESDIRTFTAIKKVRDGLVHGEEISEQKLPVRETIDLLRKFLKLHLLNPSIQRTN